MRCRRRGRSRSLVVLRRSAKRSTASTAGTLQQAARRGQAYYLSSLDSVRFEPVRECRIERRLTFDSGKIAFEARLEPPVVGQDFNRSADIETVILTARHEDATVDPVNEFPCFVFITLARDNIVLQGPIRSDDLEIIGWGELYRTRADAERHAFD